VKILLLTVQMLVFAGLTAASVYLLYRYAAYGNQQETSRLILDETENPESDTASFGSNDGLLTMTEPDTQIRVQIFGDDYQSAFHQSLEVTSGSGLVVQSAQGEELVPSGEVWTITAEELGRIYSEISSEVQTELSSPDAGDAVMESSEQTPADAALIYLKSQDDTALTLPNLVRSQSAPSYEGSLELFWTEEGIVLINEVPLEQYLESVVASEMPSDYPQAALCAQAVCARTYALQCMQNKKGWNHQADLDDSVSCQVYNNYQSTDTTRAAVQETGGEILTLDDVRYYSTSPLTEGRTDLGTEDAFRTFMDTEPDADAEYGSPWVRWSVALAEDTILNNLNRELGCTWTHLESVRMQERSGDGWAELLCFSNGQEEITAEGEYQIRKLLAPGTAAITLRDGTSAEGLQLLPSACFYIDEQTETEETSLWQIRGGGYGHGQGMSQCGAAAMAAAGADYREILDYYYGDRS
jgi:stage II sporulation protein D